MKTLFVSYICKDGERKNFIHAVREEKIDQMSRNEDGNIQYAYFLPHEDSNTLLLLEIWKDEAAFTTHCASNHFKKLGELKSKFVEQTKIEKSEIMITVEEFATKNNCVSI